MNGPLSYTLLEMFVAGKNPDLVCEDMVADLGKFLVILDGVTSKDKFSYRGTTGGRFAAETIMATLEELPDEVTARTAVDAVTSNLRDAIVAERGSMPSSLPGAQFAVYSPARAEIWRVGDVHVRNGDWMMHTPAPPTDAIAVDFRAAILEAMIAEGATIEELVANDPTWEMTLPLLSRQDAFANLERRHPLEYGVINGLPVPDRFISVFPGIPGHEIVLATDGYFSGEGTLAEAEQDLAEVIASDPLLFRRYKSFRPAYPGGSFDDRAWIRFRL